MRLPGDAAHHERHGEVHRHPHQHRSNIRAHTSEHHQHRRKQAEQRPGSAIRGGPPVAGQASPYHQARGSAKTGNKVKRQKTPMAEHTFQHRTDRPQCQHIEQDMQHAWRMQEHGCQPRPWALHHKHRSDHAPIHDCGEYGGHKVTGDDLHQPHGRAHHDNRRGDDRLAGGPSVPDLLFAGNLEIHGIYGIGRVAQ